MSNVLLSLVLIFSAAITKSTFAEKPSNQELVLSKEELDKAFVSAVKKYNLKEMRELIEAGADINVPIPHVYTSGDCDWDVESSPLIFAIEKDKPEMVKILLQVKNKLCTSLNQALDKAIRIGSSLAVKELIKEVPDMNCINNDTKDSPLILAIKHANPIAEFSRQAQARMKSRWQERKEIMQILLKVGVDINHANKDGWTALMEAVSQYDLNTVQDLLKFPEITKGSFFGFFGKKPINNADKDGNTALIIAIKNIRTSYVAGDTQGYNICINSQKILEALLKTPGIDVHHANNNGETAVALLEKLKAYQH